jgi:hypothetical protein
VSITRLARCTQLARGDRAARLQQKQQKQQPAEGGSATAAPIKRE